MSRTPAPEVAPPDLPGYRFIKNIGAGGNAQVYLYEQNLPHRKVAVKVLNESALSEAARRRFTAEANVTAGLLHRHIVQIYEANVTPDGRPYLVMPYYPRPNLAIRARRSHFSVADVLATGVQIGSAVETSHRRGVLHHDIKPQNILTDSSYDEPVLTDFGIATTKGGDGPEGLSVPWSPPEILFGTGPADERADVYSLGATLWHLLVGRSPFESPGDNGAPALMARIQSSPPPRTQRSDVPDSLEQLLRRAMAKDPAARPQSAMELIQGLQAIEQELGLPVTRAVLPSDEPSGDTQGTDTLPRLEPIQPAQPAWDDPGRSAWDAPPREETIVRGGAAGTWAPPTGTQAGEDNNNITRKRDQIRADLPGQAAGAPGQVAQPPGPARLDGWGNAPAPVAPRVRHFPREATEDATVARSYGGANFTGTGGGAQGGADFTGTGGGSFGGYSRQTAEAGPGLGTSGASGTIAPGQRRGRRGRMLALVGGGAALAVVAGVAVVALSHGGQQPDGTPASAGQATQLGGADNAVGPAAAPGTPAVKATGLSATQVKFTWTYDNPAAGDTFPWKMSGTVRHSSGEATKPDLTVTVPRGQVACLEVRVTSASGQASDYSEPACWPQ